MNLAIQKPTTVIKIKRTCDKDKTDTESKSNNINFYDLDCCNNKRLKQKKSFNFLNSCLFAGMNGENEAKRTKDSFINSIDLNHCESLNEDSILEWSNNDFINSDFKDCDNEKIRNLKSLETKPKSSIDFDFVIDGLKYDLRVKEFEITTDNVFIYFFCKDDSVSFYKQYIKYIDLSFGQPCDWLSTSETTYQNSIVNNNTLKDISNSKPFKDTIKEEPEHYSRERFIKMIDYFNQLNSCFSKTDLKAMSASLDKRNTDFIFTQTKELAVGNKSNKIMQEAIKIMSGTELDRIYENLEYDIVPISATKHGAYTIQTLLNYSTNISHRKYVMKYFKKEGEFLLAHEIGNYTFQKLLVFDKTLVSEFLVSNFNDVLSTELGIKVFKRCIEHIEDGNIEIRQKVNQLKETKPSLYTQLHQVLKNW